MQAEVSAPRIYVASLSDYNAGRLHGAWIDATDADDMRDAIAAMLKASPEPIAEEWAIHDTDGFGSYSVSEYADLDAVAAIASGIAEYGDAFSAWVNDGNEPDTDDFQDHYVGTFGSFRDYADAIADDFIPDDAPEFLKTYFDYDAFARDLEHDYCVIDRTDGYGVHVFTY